MRVLPDLKDGQMWCCGGCGSGKVISPKKIDFVYSREEFEDGSAIEMTKPKYVAPCCDSDLLLWDHGEDDFIPWEYAHKKL